MNLYRAENFSDISWLEHGFGTRGVALSDYLAELGPKDARFARTNQKHGNRVFVIDDDIGHEILEGDAFVTNSKEVVCFVRTADCVPILVCDRKNRAVGAIHAGWRGHICDVIGHTVRTMNDKFGSEAQDLVAAIGPSICPECYVVGDDVIELFSQNGFSEGLWNRRSGSFSLDLRRASEELLIASGVRRGNITRLPLCTSCHNGDFASYRREKTDNSRQVNFIYIK